MTRSLYCTVHVWSYIWQPADLRFGGSEEANTLVTMAGNSASAASADAGEVRWGIIGAGDVCEVKAGPAFQKALGSRLVAVMRRNAALAEDFAKRHGVPRWYSDVDALLADPEVRYRQ